MPVLRYYVGTGGETQIDQFNAVDYQLAPAEGAEVGVSQQLVFTWPAVSQAKYYRLIIKDASGAEVFSAVTLRDTCRYRAPSWLLPNSTTDRLSWYVEAVDGNRVRLSETSRRTLRILRE